MAVTLPKAGAERVEAEAPLRTAGCEAIRQMTDGLALARWRSLGVRQSSRQPLPRSTATASLVRAGTRNFLVFGNYEVLLQYNCANAYALAVGLLADQIQ